MGTSHARAQDVWDALGRTIGPRAVASSDNGANGALAGQVAPKGSGYAGARSPVNLGSGRRLYSEDFEIAPAGSPEP